MKEEVSRIVLVRYRVVGGPVSVDQRLTVFDDGAVELDERHRTRGPISLRLDAAELDRIRAALQEIPDWVWSRLPRLALASARSALVAFWTQNEWNVSGSYFELKRGRYSIAAEEPSSPRVKKPVLDARVRKATALLDGLRVRAVRA